MKGWAFEEARKRAKAKLEEADDKLMQERGAGLRVEGFRERWVVTLFGEVRIRRRLYRDSDGKRRFLLDEALGMDKRSPLSRGVRELCALLASYMPFGKCEELLRLLLPVGVSHTTIHRQVGKIADQALAKEEEEIAATFEQGEIPLEGERRVPILFVEGDGVSVALQRERERRGEMKVGIAYEGWEATGSKGRYRLEEKTPYIGLMGGERFWEGFSLALAKKYDLSGIGHFVVGGDGAQWVKEGAELLGGVYQLDRFHLRRELLRALRGDVETANQVYRVCIEGNVALADGLLAGEQSRYDAEQAAKIAGVRAYILNNSRGLADYRLKLAEGEAEGLRGLGGMEGNADKLVANRMKKRGMSWTKRGGQRMGRLILMQHWGEIPGWETRPSEPAPEPKTTVQPKTKPGKGYCDGVWLAAHMPIFSGPHSGRLWIQSLKQMIHGGKSL